MGYKFGRKSKQRLLEVDKDLQFLCTEAIKIIDFSVVEGHRGEKRQNQLLVAKATKKKWPNSKHNKLPSEAVDVYPYPVIIPDKKNQKKLEFMQAWARFYHLIGIIKGIAYSNNIQIRCGLDWNCDGNILNDGKFIDAPHIEIILEK